MRVFGMVGRRRVGFSVMVMFITMVIMIPDIYRLTQYGMLVLRGCPEMPNIVDSIEGSEGGEQQDEAHPNQGVQ
jgi:hypothetical protein